MTRLDPEARVAIRTLVFRGTSYSAIARLLNVTEGAIRYQVARMALVQIAGTSESSAAPCRLQAPSTAFQTAGAAPP